MRKRIGSSCGRFFKESHNNFDFLIEDLGYESLPDRKLGNECSVGYRVLPDIAIIIVYEIGKRPWVQITCRSPKGGHKEYFLDNLIRTKGIKHAEEVLSSPIGESFDSVERVIRFYSVILRKHFLKELSRQVPFVATGE